MLACTDHPHAIFVLQVGSSNQKAKRDGAANDAKSRKAFAGLPILEAANVTARLPDDNKWWDVGKIHFSPESGAYRQLNIATLDLINERCPGL